MYKIDYQCFMKIRCLVADDEFLARRLLAEYIGRLHFLELVGECENALQVLQFIENQTVDLIFLDIQMPLLSGVELLRTHQKLPLAIFVTASADFAIEGYSLHIADYLLKPVGFERFVQAVNKAALFLGNRPNQTDKNHLFVRADGKTLKINTKEICYIEGLKEYVRIDLSVKQIITLASLQDLTQELSNRGFERIHRSYIVNLEKVEGFDKDFVQIKDTQLPIGKSFKENFIKNFLNKT